MGYGSPLEHPALRAAAASVKGRKARSGPVLETDFIIKTEQLARNKSAPGGKRLYCALFAILALSSLRFGDTVQIEKLFDSGSAIFGIIVNNKDKTGELMTCATPLSGLSGDKNWAEPIFDFRGRLAGKSKTKMNRFHALPPFVPPEWVIDLNRSASYGLIHAKLG